MGWFDNQIRERIKKDNARLEDSFYGLSSVIMGKKTAGILESGSVKTKNAIEEICRYYKVPIGEPAESEETSIEDYLEYMLRPSGIMRRRVKLSGEWWKDCIGALLCETQKGGIAALIPAAGGYAYCDYESGGMIKVSAGNADLLKEDAVCFYKALPNSPLGIRELLIFMASCLSRWDIAAVAAAALLVSVLGLLTPYINQMLFSDIIPSGESILVFSVGVLLLGTSISVFLISAAKNLMQAAIISKLNISLQSAVMSRVINLPIQFFKDYSAGELAGRIQNINSLCEIICQFVLGAGLTAVFSVIYILQIISIAPGLVLPAVIAVMLQILVIILGISANLALIRKKMTARNKVNGIIFSLFSGIQKIKLGGGEKRAFSKWANIYKIQAEASYNPPLIIKIQPVLEGTAVLTGMLLIYWAAAAANAEIYQFVAFTAAFGLVSGAMLTLISMAGSLAYVKPILEMIEPILKAVPETSENKKILTKVSGGIELNNVSFRYSEDSPLIIDNLSLKINRGQYIAIVGKTGCGKSTLMRLLLGFEQPKTGAVYYDGQDISKADLKSLRRHIGVVLQNGKLFQGDVFSNIIISAPNLNLSEAWEAAEMAGVADDIRNMPMGMHTIISEGAGGISGGQKQRLMIARAIAHKPKILMFDEATSALDNITQRQVSESLNNLKSTRIVIAHRISTIKSCDRIIVLDKGRIAEDGKYDELIELGGVFAELVKRQQIDKIDG